MWNALRAAAVGVALLLAIAAAPAQYVQVQLPLTQLPQDHEYQRTLRTFLGTLRPQDFALERKEFTAAPPNADPEDRYRLWLLTLHLPAVGAAALPPESFTLKAMEGPKGLAIPAAPADSQMLAWLANWDYAGNPYRGSKALKLRALALAAVDLVMLDYLYEHDPQKADRADFLGGNLIWLGYTCMTAKDALPADARAAILTGLKKHVLRINRWGPRGAMTDMDLFAPVGLWYCARAIDDAEVTKVAESYAKRLFTEERFFHPAGYFVDVGCFDTSYNGISLYFATWAALATDWPFARDAVDKAFRLRAHLSLPDPGGRAHGPSQMSSRTSADPPNDQWNFAHRPYGAAQVTDEALHLAPLPADDAMRAAPARIAHHFNEALKPRPGAAKPGPWKESHWSGSMNFPYEHYRKGYYARRLKLEKEGSPLARPLYARKGPFVHTFPGAFVVARFDGYAAVVHTGPVRGWPYGLGGGQLSAFWTPEAGPALLGRRRGMQGAVRDATEEWRTWPVHAVSGATAGGEFFTSSAVARPDVDSKVADGGAEVKVTGTIPLGKAGIAYQRRFVLRPAGMTVQSSAKPRDAGKLAELYETVPVFLHNHPDKDVNLAVRLQVGDRWVDAGAEPTAGVRAARVERFDGAVVLTFDRPRSVRLSPKEWKDGYQTAATCRTLLIDLLDNAGAPRAVESVSVEYTLTPAPRRAPEKK